MMHVLTCVVLAVATAPVAALWSANGQRGLQADGTKAGVTPVEKVISLLGQLSEQIAEEGAKEAAEHDKFACFCKEQADAKRYSIEKSDEKIEKLQATIEKLAGEISQLNSEIADLGKKITGLEEEIKKETETREAAHKEYLIADANVTEAITAVRGAIEALKASKTGMKDAKLNFAQLSAASMRYPSNSQLKLVAALLSKSPPAYEYRSNDIIAMLERLLVDFKTNKKNLFDDEFEVQSIFDKKVLGMTNEKQFAEKEKNEKTAISDAKTEEKEAATADLTAETEARNADQEFQDELTEQCQTKAQEWDQRSKSRAEELTAISEAKEILKSGVNPNYSANKKLVGLEKGSKVSLIQLSQLNAGSAGADTSLAVRQVLQHLEEAASKLHSPVLSALAAKAALQEDHFVKVRGLIKDLISKLEEEALAEADTKSFCDKEMAKAIGSRDGEKLKAEEQQATIAKQEAAKAQLVRDISDLSDGIAELAKALNEAAELRAAEKKDNEVTLAEAKAGQAAVEQAMKVLKEFYGSSLVQYKPPKSDREGKTVADRAPEMSWSGEYNGKQDASKGIIGLLEVILSDFERTVSTVDSEEKAAQEEFEKFETETKDSIEKKKAEKQDKEKAVSTAEEVITTAKDELEGAEKLHALALEELEKLQAMCVEGEESYAERREKREQEIEALKSALKILEDWKA